MPLAGHGVVRLLNAELESELEARLLRLTPLSHCIWQQLSEMRTSGYGDIHFGFESQKDDAVMSELAEYHPQIKVTRANKGSSTWKAWFNEEHHKVERERAALEPFNSLKPQTRSQTK